MSRVAEVNRRPRNLAYPGISHGSRKISLNLSQLVLLSGALAGTRQLQTRDNYSPQYRHDADRYQHLHQCETRWYKMELP